jgi:hypothetical protein
MARRNGANFGAIGGDQGLTGFGLPGGGSSRPPFPLSQDAFQNGPQQSRARSLARRKRTLDGVDRSESIEKEGKGGKIGSRQFAASGSFYRAPNTSPLPHASSPRSEPPPSDPGNLSR